MIVRDAVPADVAAIVELYNALIPTSTVTWTETLQTVAERSCWFDEQQRQGFPVLVAQHGDAVVGFSSYGHFRGAGWWPGYRFSVEHTIHVQEAHWGSSVGRLLIEELVERARSAGKHVLVGAIDGDNEASIRFHERLGFTEVARMPEVGCKFGRWLDLVLVQRLVDRRSAP